MKTIPASLLLVTSLICCMVTSCNGDGTAGAEGEGEVAEGEGEGEGEEGEGEGEVAEGEGEGEEGEGEGEEGEGEGEEGEGEGEEGEGEGEEGEGEGEEGEGEGEGDVVADVRRFRTTRGVDENAATMIGDDVFVAGSLSLLASEREAMISIVSDAPVTKGFAGVRNDQLYGIASDASRYYAVGLTRSFLGNQLTSDQSLLLVGDATDVTARVRLVGQNDTAIQTRTVTPMADGIAVAGQYQIEAGVFAATLNSALDVVGAQAYVSTDPTVTAHTIRHIAHSGDRLAVLGSLRRGDVVSGFIVFVNASTFAIESGFALTADVNLSPHDGVFVGNQFRLVGSVGPSGFIVDFDLDNEFNATTSVVEQRRLTGVVVHNAETYVFGHSSSRAGVYVVTTTGLAGTAFAGLAPLGSFFSRSALFSTANGLLAVMDNNDDTMVIPLTNTLRTNCEAAAFGFSEEASFAMQTSINVAAHTFAPVALTVTAAPAPLTVADEALDEITTGTCQ
jgi:hypothetical protein